ncbi:hypothetical protein PGTUg99_000330 [Puccinia graminis f. sp. tritici]|uniref:Uncharacterized protein n=1 Tax=Puccinia graminis f. sp. tritici TaxID=56615 RepID=A0A5B0RCW7_PUCGR|nr:hypothetical protein PGTUg99_000330 [Puccinia graminis f. sp. tritici]
MIRSRLDSSPNMAPSSSVYNNKPPYHHEQYGSEMDIRRLMEDSSVGSAPIVVRWTRTISSSPKRPNSPAQESSAASASFRLVQGARLARLVLVAAMMSLMTVKTPIKPSRI